jgi:hypothetical protein
MAGDDRRSRVQTWLFNPFHYLSGEPSLGLGLLAIAGTAALGFASGYHMDGVLDLHHGRPAPLWLFMAQGVINWSSFVFFAAIAGALLSRSRLRLVDVAGMQALARAPQLIAVAFMAAADPRCGGALFRATPTAECGAGAVALFGFALVITLFATAWMVALMHRAFAVACNVDGGRGVGAFVAALIPAEVLSKVLIVVLVRTTGGA